jgi:integration host factor subunit alpha
MYSEPRMESKILNYEKDGGGPVEDGRRTLTRADLADAVYRAVGLSRSESADMVEVVLGEISDVIAAGETVKLSSFGSFIVRSKGERLGRNPKTGVEVPIAPRRVIVFKPSNIMKARINGLSGDGETDD